MTPDLGKMQNTAVQTGDRDDHGARFGADGNHIQPVRGEKFGAPAENLFDC